MKKILTVVILIIVSCSKKSSQGDYCWVCEIDCPQTQYDLLEEYCFDTPDEKPTPSNTDPLGNDCNYWCRRK